MARTIFICAKAPSQLSPRTSYFGVTCKCCGVRIVLLDALGVHSFDAGETMLRTKCPDCGEKDETYGSTDVQCFQPGLRS